MPLGTNLGSTDAVLAACGDRVYAEYNTQVSKWILVCDGSWEYAIIPAGEYSRFSIPCNGGPAYWDGSKWVCSGVSPGPGPQPGPVGVCPSDQVWSAEQQRCVDVTGFTFGKIMRWLTATDPGDGAIVRGLPNYVVAGAAILGFAVIRKKGKGG